MDGVFTAFTYEELDRRASVLALALARVLGVRRGELVALVSDNRPEWLVCSLAIHFLGAVDVPRASETPPDILEAILRHAEPAVVILEDAGAAAAGARGAAAGCAPASSSTGATARRPAPAPTVQAAGDGACAVYTLAELTALGEAAWPESPREVARRREEVAPRGPGDRHLHVGHDRLSQGRRAHARQLRAQPARAPASARDRARARRHAAAAVARLRAPDAAHVPQPGAAASTTAASCTCAATCRRCGRS